MDNEEKVTEQTCAEEKPETKEATAEEWEEALRTAVAQRDEAQNQAARALADLANYRKRNANVRAEAYDDGNADAIAELLPVLDNFERAIGAAEGAGENQSLLDGVKMIQKQLLDALCKRGLEVLSPVGEQFDPNLHHAVFRVSPEEADGAEPGTICQVLQTGYTCKGKLLRAPMVKVVADD